MLSSSPSLRQVSGAIGFGGWDVVEADEIDVVAGAVLGDFEQVKDAKKARSAGQFRCDVGEADGVDGIDFDLAFFHAIASACLHARVFPDADAAGDISATNGVAKALGEHHGRSLRGQRARRTEHRERRGIQYFAKTFDWRETRKASYPMRCAVPLSLQGVRNATVIASARLAASGRRRTI